MAKRKSKWRTKQLKNNGYCRYCGTNKKLSVDHIIPTSRGGVDDATNYQLLCAYCNNMKAAHTDHEIANIFHDIKKNGLMYEWEKKFDGWLGYIEVKRKEYGLHPLRW